MKRYRSCGGFRRLTSMASALSIVRLVLLVLALCFASQHTALCILSFLCMLPLDFFSHRLMQVYGLTTFTAIILDATADVAASAVFLLFSILQFAYLQIPACFLFVLSILSLVRNLLRIKQAAVL